MPGGRPTKYTKEIADRICDAVADGIPLVKVCEPEDMPNRSTVRLWRNTNEEFSAMYAHAREEFADSLADQLLPLADECREGAKVKTDKDGNEETTTGDMVERSRLQLETRKWLAAKILPKKYGERLELDANLRQDTEVIRPHVPE